MTNDDAQRTEEPTRSQLLRFAQWYGYVSDVLTPSRIGLLLGAALLAIVGLSGGFGSALEDAETVPVAKAGELTRAAPFDLTVKRAVAFDELTPVFRAESGYRYLSVSVDVTNSSDAFVSATVLAGGVSLDVDGQKMMTLTSGSQPFRPQIVRTADSLSQPTFQPGLTTNVVLVWQQSIAEPVPAEITVAFDQHTWRRSSMDRVYGWRDQVPAFRITVPVEKLAGE